MVVLSPLLQSPLEPALLTQFTGVGLSLAVSGPIPRSVNCAHVPSTVYVDVDWYWRTGSSRSCLQV